MGQFKNKELIAVCTTGWSPMAWPWIRAYEKRAAEGTFLARMGARLRAPPERPGRCAHRAYFLFSNIPSMG